MSGTDSSGGAALVVALAALLAPGCSRGAEAEVGVVLQRSQVPGDVEVTLVPWSLPAVEAEVPGHGSALFLIDTGSEISLFDVRAIRSFGLPVEPLETAVTLTRGGAAKRRIHSGAAIPRLWIGDASLDDFHAPVTDLHSLREDLAGVIGQDVLAGWRLLFDPKRRSLWILGGGEGTGGASPLASLAPDWSFVELPSRWLRGTARVEARIAGAPLSMIVDTGARPITLPLPWVAAMRLDSAGTTTIHDIGGSQEEPRYRLPRLELSTAAFTDLAVLGETRPEGLLGWDVLGQAPLLVDGPGRRVLLAVARAAPGSSPEVSLPR